MLRPPAPYNFAERLREASKILQVRESELVSIKIRSVSQVGGFETVYLGDSDYSVINHALEMSEMISCKDLGSACNGRARLCEFENCYCLYIEHESGPEVILHIIALAGGAVGATAFAANQVVKLINNIYKSVRQSQSKGRDNRGRFVATSIEKRVASGQKLIRQIGAVAKASEKAIKSVEELFK